MTTARPVPTAAISSPEQLSSVRSLYAAIVFGLISFSAGIQAEPIVMAHRGFSAQAPENTLSAFNAARGYSDHIEFDVQVASDGELVVIHDDTVQRTTRFSGLVSSFSAAQLTSMDAGSWFSPAYAGEKIPLLGEALETILRFAKPIIDRKSGPAAKYVEEIRKAGAVERALLFAIGDLDFIRRVNQLEPRIELGLVPTEPITAAGVSAWLNAGVKVLLLPYSHYLSLNAETIARLAPFQVVLWTVNDSTALAKIASMGVTGVLTDVPDVAQKILAPHLADRKFALPFRTLSVRPGGMLALRPSSPALVGLVQWSSDDKPLANAAGRTMVVRALGPTGVGVYRLAAAGASRAGDGAATTVVLTPGTSNLANLSARLYCGTTAENNVVLAGLVTDGESDTELLLRAIGPGLRRFGVTDALSTPLLQIFNAGGQAFSEPTAGSSVAREPALMSAAFGAFEIEDGSGDATRFVRLPSGLSSISAHNADGTPGVVLLECYRGSGNPESSRLINLSVRAAVNATHAITAGFVIAGNVARTVMIRAVGPGLEPFGVNGALQDPALRLLDAAGSLVAHNDDWVHDIDRDTLGLVSASVGAFPLEQSSKDSVILITLPPGSYTAEVASGGEAEGVVLVEVYDVDR